MLNFKPQSIKKDFPILSRQIHGKPLVYLDNAATTQKPSSVIEAISDYYKLHNANTHRGIHTLGEEATEIQEKGRRKVAEFINAEPEEIIFTRNATEALNLVAYSFGIQNLKKGGKVVITRMEHHANILPWQMVCDKTGAELVYWEMDEEGMLQGEIPLIPPLQKGENTPPSSPCTRGGNGNNLILRKGKNIPPTPPYIKGGIVGVPLDDPKVKILALTQASNVLGTINPIKEITKFAKSHGITVVVDAAQSAPNMTIDVKDLDVDFLVFSGHKMLGPMGIGVLFGKKELLEKMPPFLRGGSMIDVVNDFDSTWNELPFKFEAGTPDVASIAGLTAAIEYLENVGMGKILQHEQEIGEYCMQRLAEFNKVKVYGPQDFKNRVGLVSFSIDGVHPHDVATIFDSEGAAIRSGHHCAQPLHRSLGVLATSRISPYIYNSKDEIDKAMEALKKVLKVFG